MINDKNLLAYYSYINHFTLFRDNAKPLMSIALQAR